MVATISATFQQPTIAPVNSPSISKDSVLSFRFSGVPDITNMRLVWGIAASAPATYGALTSASTSPLPGDFDTLQIRATDVSGSLLFSGGFGDGSPGDKLWLCLFTGSRDVPSSGDAPAAVAGPFTLVA